MANHFSDEEEEDDLDGCPHCDVMMLFKMYRGLGWDQDDIIEDIVRGLASVLASAPKERRDVMVAGIQDVLPEWVDQEETHTAMAQAEFSTQH